MQTEIPRINDISILYVEDEAAIRDGYGRALRRLSNKVILASNGKDGLDLFKKYKPDIVVSDIKMPVMDGIEMLQNIKDIDPECYIIFTTAHNDNEYLLDALELQVNAYLQKPVQKDLLKAKVEKFAENILKEKMSLIQQKEIEKQKVILQNVLDHEQNLLIVTDFKQALFANRSFLELFNVDDVTAFNRTCIQICNIFLPLPGYLHQGLMQKGENFYDLIERSDDTKRMVTLIDQHGEPKAYHINVSKITHEEQDSYLLSLTDITMMNIEKLSTEKKAYYDNLTEVYNRNKFDEVFESELNRIKRYGTVASLVVLDIDHFKKFNDTYGHLTGDKVLKALAGTISENIRNTDVFARWGGEEFVLLLPETKIDAACALSEKLRKSVARIHIGETIPVTSSFGVTEIAATDSMKSAFERADHALYQAKAAGRDRVLCFQVDDNKVREYSCGN